MRSDDKGMPDTAASTVQDPADEGDYSFTPVAASKLPRAWERKPETPFQPRFQEHKIWKRYGLRDKNTDDTVDQAREPGAGKRVVKKLRTEGVAGDSNDGSVPFVGMSWDEPEEPRTRKRVRRSPAKNGPAKLPSPPKISHPHVDGSPPRNGTPARRSPSKRILPPTMFGATRNGTLARNMDISPGKEDLKSFPADSPMKIWSPSKRKTPSKKIATSKALSPMKALALSKSITPRVGLITFRRDTTPHSVGAEENNTTSGVGVIQTVPVIFSPPSEKELSASLTRPKSTIDAVLASQDYIVDSEPQLQEERTALITGHFETDQIPRKPSVERTSKECPASSPHNAATGTPFDVSQLDGLAGNKRHDILVPMDLVATGVQKSSPNSTSQEEAGSINIVSFGSTVEPTYIPAEPTLLEQNTPLPSEDEMTRSPCSMNIEKEISDTPALMLPMEEVLMSEIEVLDAPVNALNGSHTKGRISPKYEPETNAASEVHDATMAEAVIAIKASCETTSSQPHEKTMEMEETSDLSHSPEITTDMEEVRKNADEVTDSSVTPLPVPALESQVVIGSLHDEDTALLRNFLSRAKAKKAAEAASNPQRHVSPRKSPRLALTEVDNNTFSPQKGIAEKDSVATLASEAEDETLEATTASNRRSVRGSTRSKSVKVTKDAPSSIPVRRADGAEHLVLQKSESQELAMTTRTNTTRNKGGAKAPKIKMKELSKSATDDLEAGVTKREGLKVVSWNEKLVYFGEESVEEELKEEEAGPVRKLRRLGKAQGTPAAKKTATMLPSPRKVTKAAAVGTPAPKRRGKAKA